MGLSNELISMFVKATKDTNKSSSDTTVYGTVVKNDSGTYVKLDGSETLTPVSTTSDVRDKERVAVTIKNHTATITGNMSSPSARTEDVQMNGSKITELDTLVADKVSTKTLEAEIARINTLVADNVTIKGTLTANEADIETLKADYAEIGTLVAGKLSADDADLKYATIATLEADYATIKNLEATNAEIENLKADTAEIDSLIANKADIEDLEVTNAEIENLKATKADIASLETTYANIDFSNIGKAAIEQFYATSGIIQDLVIGDQTITGELVGVTIKGDLIEGNTIKADKLVVLGDDGIYYTLNVSAEKVSAKQTEYNSLHGSIITANSITAEKISVKDLVAFDATIGGFEITEKSLYSGKKESVKNTTQGIYLDKYGQLAVGDANNYITYYKDTDGNYKLAISAGAIRLSTRNQNVEEAIDEAVANLNVGARNLIRNSTDLLFVDYYFSGTFIADYDSNSKSLTIKCGASASGDGHVTLRTSAVCSDDGAGNVTLE